MDIYEFGQHFDKLCLRFNVPQELSFAYYDALKSIPADRFKQICDRVFIEYDRLPKPLDFLDLSYEIARREMSSAPRLESSEVKELDRMSEEQLIANRRRLAQMCRSMIAQNSMPDIEEVDSDPEISKLNRWLKDDLLRKEAIAQINSRSDLKVQFSGLGEIVGVYRGSDHA